MNKLKSSLTTLCYLEKDDSYLMMHRVKKKNDENHDKWIGVGGHAEDYESPEDCLLREVYEETGLKLTQYRFRGIVTFALQDVETQYMCLYTATGWEGEMVTECDEGNLEWVKKDRIDSLSLWEGDKVFFKLLSSGAPFFSLKLHYDQDELKQCVLNGRSLDWKQYLYGDKEGQEYFDIVDEYGMPTGIVKERGQVHAQGDLHRTSHVWIVRKRNKRMQVLLQKRSENKDSHPGCYDISSAGHIPAGCNYEESAVRELYEELSIEASEKEVLYCGTRRIRWQDVFYGKPFIDNQVSRVYLLWRDVDIKTLRLQESEISAAEWFDLEEAISLVQSNAIRHCIFLEELFMVKSAVENTGFRIERASYEDISDVISVEMAAYQNMKEKSWYLTDDEAFMRRHVEDEGFILKAMYGERMAAFLAVRFPKESPDNLFKHGESVLHLPHEKSHLSAHMESAAVHPDFVGNGLMKRLLEAAVSMTRELGYEYLFATVHPQNRFSRNNLDKLGFHSITELIKYDGYPRCIYFLDCSH